MGIFFVHEWGVFQTIASPPEPILP